MDKIEKNLYLGNYSDAIRAIKNKSVDCIINVSRKGYECPKIGIFCHHIAIQDIDDESTIAYQKIALELLVLSLDRNQSVLVHCAKGVSRSASIIMMYLIIIKKMSYSDAYAYIKGKRPTIHPDKFENAIKEVVKFYDPNAES